MPKIKTNSGAKKRFALTGTGNGLGIPAEAIAHQVFQSHIFDFWFTH